MKINGRKKSYWIDGSKQRKIVQSDRRKIEANNEKLSVMMDEKIEANNEKISVMIDEKIKENNKILDKRFDQLEEKIIDNNFYFEEKYGKKIDAMFEKIMMDG